jgi:MoaA/NifB/PqqE/SkfB family radical SAM enzyme
MNVFDSGALKLLSYREDVLRWLRCDSTPPICVEIHPTERCQHRCPDCQAKYSLRVSDVRVRARSGHDLDLSMLRSLWDSPPSGVVISGNTGDPLLHPRITELLGELRDRAIPYVLICNGEGVTPEIAAIASNSAHGIRVSLDAFDADSFRRAHGVGSGAWERVISGVRTLVEGRSQVPAGTRCLIGVGYLTDDRTKAGMLPAAILARALGVDYIQFRPYHYRAHDIDAELDACREMADDSFQVLASGQKYSSVGEAARGYRVCHASTFYSVIDAQGDVYICCHHVGNAAGRWGSLRNTDWQTLLGSRMRRQVLSEFETEGCVPLCRLDTHNRALELTRKTGDVPRVQPAGDVLAHRSFL